MEKINSDNIWFEKIKKHVYKTTGMDLNNNNLKINNDITKQHFMSFFEDLTKPKTKCKKNT